MEGDIKEEDTPVNPLKSAINNVVQSLKFFNLFALLYNRESDIDVDHQNEKQETPLNYLAKELKTSNVDEITECMNLLLLHNAKIDLPDENRIVPLKHVLQNKELPEDKKYELVYMLLLRYSHEDLIATEAWNYIQQFHMKRHSELGRKTLDEIIANPDESDSDKYYYLISLMNRYVNRSDTYALNCLLQTFPANSEKDNVDILIKAISFGNTNLMNNILNAPNLNISPEKSANLVNRAISGFPAEDNTEKHKNYVECFRILLMSKIVDVNKADRNKIPPLIHAAKYNNDVAVNELFSQGAYLGMRSDYDKNCKSPAANVWPIRIEDRFNQCVTVDKVESRDSYIHLNFSNISQPPNEDNIVHNDMTIITHIRKTPELRHLLQHPVITCFLIHRFNQYSKIFFTHFAIYLVFVILMTIHIFSSFPNQKSKSYTVQFLCWLLILYLLIREIVQFFLGWLHYFRSFIFNIMDILIIFLSILTLLEFGTRDTQKKIAAYTCLLAYFKLLMLKSLMRIPMISIPLFKLFEVAKTLMKYLSLLFFLLIPFSLCFHIRFSNVEKSNETEKSTLNFDYILSSIIKSFIMLTGEYEASNIKSDGFFDYLMIFLFVYLMGICFFNLLIAEAVNDIPRITDNAEIYRAIGQINFLSTCEVFLNHPWWKRWRLLTVLKKLINPNYKPVREIKVRQYRFPHKLEPVYYATNTITPDVRADDPPIQAPSHSNKKKKDQECNTPLLPKGRNVTLPPEDRTDSDLEKSKKISLSKDAYIPPSSSFGDKNLRSTLQKIIEYFTNLIEIYQIDDVTFKRALSIAVKERKY